LSVVSKKLDSLGH